MHKSWSVWLVGVAVGVLVLGMLFGPHSVQAQPGASATLTVLRGQAAVLKADGSPISPASSGLAIGAGDQVASLAGSGALVTFFDGSEVELGSDATIIIRDLGRQGSATTITIESVVGSTVHHVVQMVDPSSTYRVESAATVAAVRGTDFGHRSDPAGGVSVAVADGVVEFPGSGQPINPGERRWVTAKGSVQDGKFTLGTSLFDVVAEDVSGGEDGPDQQNNNNEKERENDRRDSNKKN